MIYNRLYLKATNTEIKVERTERICTCALCTVAIVRDEPRLTIVQRNTGRLPPGPRGGMIFKRNLFFHPECFINWMDKAGRNVPGFWTCYDCGASHDRDDFNGKISLPRGTSRQICAECMSSGRWQFCDRCRYYWQKYRTSPLLHNGVASERLICDHCAEHSGVLTVKEAKRLRRERERSAD